MRIEHPPGYYQAEDGYWYYSACPDTPLEIAACLYGNDESLGPITYQHIIGFRAVDVPYQMSLESTW